MVFIYLEDLKCHTKIIRYFNYMKISYTTNLRDQFDTILVGQLNKKTMKLINQYQGKKIIFLTYGLETKIIECYKGNNKKNKVIKNQLEQFISQCNLVIVSEESIKKILTKGTKRKIVVIPYELPIINISNARKDIYLKYNLSKRRKKILVIDYRYEYLNELYLISNIYSKYDFLYLGYKPQYLMKNKEIEVLSSLPSNVILIPYHDLNVFSDLCKICNLVINFNDKELNIEYFYTILLLKKQLLQKKSILYEQLIDNKNCYIFDDEDELRLKLKKIMESRVANLSDEGYELIKKYNFENISKTFNMYLNQVEKMN